jgi:cytosine/adenosine deaminase-related metal-dependent hydrolase
MSDGSGPAGETIVRLVVAGVADAHWAERGPGGELLELVVALGDPPWSGRLLGVGPVGSTDVDGAGGRVIEIDRRDAAALPAFVNAHTHLDLTHVGPKPYDPAGGFVGWVDMVRRSRSAGSAASVRAAVVEGVRRSLAGGVVAVGDVAGAGGEGEGIDGLAAAEALRDSGLLGVSFVELFGLGRREAAARQRIAELVERAERERAAASGGAPRVRLGAQPHAPYSAGPGVYRAAGVAARSRLPTASHLAETPEEFELVAHGRGPMRTFLETLGVYDGSAFGGGRTPIEHVAAAGGLERMLVAHAHGVSDGDIDLLTRANAAVAYCPRCAAYFERERAFGPHRFAELRAAGVPVALGTDSVINLPAAEADRLSTLNEARLLVRRGACDAPTALAMCTTDGARALGLDESLFRLRAGEDSTPGERGRAIAGVVLIRFDGAQDVRESAMRGGGAPELVRRDALDARTQTT